MNQEPNTVETSSKPLRVLVADDNIVSRRPLEVALRKWGYEVVPAASGTEAWRILQDESAPRIAILDWMMPGMSGPEVCMMVRKLKREYYTYIIMLTSRSEREDFISGMQSGADDYLVKPPDFNELTLRLGPARRIVEIETELLRVKEELKVRATRDALTSLWNRSATMELLVREISRVQREHSPMGLVLVDLDFFKKVNDNFGHLVGDSVLRETAIRMLGTVRPYDSVGRYGGEEFLVILPGCDLEAATVKAEALRHAVADAPMHIGACTVQLTASFGVTSVSGGPAVPPDVVIARADNALYMAKHAGRNCVVPLSLEAAPQPA
jgi:two-component system, cell cycle response regulator